MSKGVIVKRTMVESSLTGESTKKKPITIVCSRVVAAALLSVALVALAGCMSTPVKISTPAKPPAAQISNVATFNRLYAGSIYICRNSPACFYQHMIIGSNDPVVISFYKKQVGSLYETVDHLGK